MPFQAFKRFKEFQDGHSTSCKIPRVYNFPYIFGLQNWPYFIFLMASTTLSKFLVFSLFGKIDNQIPRTVAALRNLSEG